MLRDSRLIWPAVQPAKPMWFCRSFPACDTYVRCHDGGTDPMGSLAGPRLRKLRGDAHKAFDPLWQEGGKVIGRAMAYLVAGHVLGISELHIGQLDEEQCLRLLGSMTEIEDALTAYADRLLHPRKGWSDPELEVLEAIFSEDYGQSWSLRVSAGELSKIGLLASKAIATGVVALEEDVVERRWAVLTSKGQLLLARGPERDTR